MRYFTPRFASHLPVFHLLSARLRIAVLLLASVVVLSGCQLTPTTEPPEEEPAVTVEDEETECECPSPSPNQICEIGPELEPAPQPMPAPVCPKPARPKNAEPKTLGDMLVIGRVEYAYLQDNLRFKARIDTGAGLTSLHASDLVEFERDGKAWVRFAVQEKKNSDKVFIEQPVKRFINIKQLTGDPQRRPIIVMAINIGPLEERVEVTLTDRSGYLYEVLIGRNFLRDRAVVDVSRKFTTKPPSTQGQ